MSIEVPAQRLGAEPVDPQRAIARFEQYQPILRADDLESHPKNPQSHSWYILTWMTATDAATIATTYFLNGNWADCAKWCRNTGGATAYYLMGDWKQKEVHDDGSVNAAAWFERQPIISWTAYLGDALGWSAVGMHWDVIDELLTFPTDKVVADDDGLAIRNYFVGLARWWKDDQDVAWVNDVKETRGAGSKGAHLLSDVVAGIAARDAKSTVGSLKNYVKWFLKGRDHPRTFPMNATFLWHVARRKGLALELPDDIDMFLFRLPESA